LNQVKNHTVAEGECLHSIAKDHGFLWEALWNHEKNAELKKNRSDPERLQAGDVVFMPDLKPKSEACPTEKAYWFRKKIQNCIRFDSDVKPGEPEILDAGAEAGDVEHLDTESAFEEPDIFLFEVEVEAANYGPSEPAAAEDTSSEGAGNVEAGGKAAMPAGA
jgi:hypothetical protein